MGCTISLPDRDASDASLRLPLAATKQADYRSGQGTARDTGLRHPGQACPGTAMALLARSAWVQPCRIHAMLVAGAGLQCLAAAASVWSYLAGTQAVLSAGAGQASAALVLACCGWALLSAVCLITASWLGQQVVVAYRTTATAWCAQLWLASPRSTASAPESLQPDQHMTADIQAVVQAAVQCVCGVYSNPYALTSSVATWIVTGLSLAAVPGVAVAAMAGFVVLAGVVMALCLRPYVAAVAAATSASGAARYTAATAIAQWEDLYAWRALGAAHHLALRAVQQAVQAWQRVAGYAALNASWSDWVSAWPYLGSYILLAPMASAAFARQAGECQPGQPCLDLAAFSLAAANIAMCASSMLALPVAVDALGEAIGRASKLSSVLQQWKAAASSDTPHLELAATAPAVAALGPGLYALDEPCEQGALQRLLRHCQVLRPISSQPQPLHSLCRGESLDLCAFAICAVGLGHVLPKVPPAPRGVFIAVSPQCAAATGALMPECAAQLHDARQAMSAISACREYKLDVACQMRRSCRWAETLSTGECLRLAAAVAWVASHRAARLGEPARPLVILDVQAHLDPQHARAVVQLLSTAAQPVLLATPRDTHVPALPPLRMRYAEALAAWAQPTPALPQPASFTAAVASLLPSAMSNSRPRTAKQRAVASSKRAACTQLCKLGFSSWRSKAAQWAIVGALLSASLAWISSEVAVMPGLLFGQVAAGHSIVATAALGTGLYGLSAVVGALARASGKMTALHWYQAVVRDILPRVLHTQDGAALTSRAMAVQDARAADQRVLADAHSATQAASLVLFGARGRLSLLTVLATLAALAWKAWHVPLAPTAHAVLPAAVLVCAVLAAAATACTAVLARRIPGAVYAADSAEGQLRLALTTARAAHSAGSASLHEHTAAVDAAVSTAGAASLAQAHIELWPRLVDKVAALLGSAAAYAVPILLMAYAARETGVRTESAAQFTAALFMLTGTLSSFNLYAFAGADYIAATAEALGSAPRVWELTEALDDYDATADAQVRPPAAHVDQHACTLVSLGTVLTQRGLQLTRPVKCALQGTTWLQGPSGAGKSSLLRALHSALRAHCAHCVLVPACAILLPGSLHELLSFPHITSDSPLDWRCRALLWCQALRLLDTLQRAASVQLDPELARQLALHTGSPNSYTAALSAAVDSSSAARRLLRASCAWHHVLTTCAVRRLAIARCAILRPRVLLADEPLAGVQPELVPVCVEALQQASSCLVIASHVGLPGYARPIQVSQCVRLQAAGHVMLAGPAPDV